VKKLLSLNAQNLPLAVTIALFALMYGFGSVMYDGYFSWQVFLNLFVDNAFLCIVAIGMTFVILSGGIDLSVGSVVALATMIAASLLEFRHWNPWAVIALVLVLGALFGAAMGLLIHFFRIPAFIVTLGGMFLARGLCYLISIDSISITDPTFTALSQERISVGVGEISPSVIVALVFLAVAMFLAHYTNFGRTVYAIGGNERSAELMGLPVARTKVLIYTLSSFCAAAGGLVFAFYMLSGYGLHAQGLELDAIAATVIGGTLLTGGVGYVFGTLFGVLILGQIQTLIMFDGSLSSWWTKIAIGALLCLFCLMQRGLESIRERRKGTGGRIRKKRVPAAAPKTEVVAEVDQRVRNAA